MCLVIHILSTPFSSSLFPGKLLEISDDDLLGVFIKETRASGNSNMAAAIGRFSRCFGRFAGPNRLLKQTPAVACVRLVNRKHFK